MNKIITIRSTVVLLMTAACVSARAEPVSVLGPLEAMSSDGTTITVLGQTYSTDAKGFSEAPGKSRTNIGGRFSFPVGTYIAVVGERNSAGAQFATSVKVVGAGYVP